MGLDKLDKKVNKKKLEIVKLDENMTKEYEEILAKVEGESGTDKILVAIEKVYRLINNINRREERTLFHIEKKVEFIVDAIEKSNPNLNEDSKRKKEIKELEQKLKKLKEV